ncbi:hypothetical protein DPMN_157841 [Dreissena polymorpha]|uniref:Uncharacterized protein n=1 Tax=Dreissena polymorpha TaxID=45954 RepID=A0A9D4ELA9_DREPO|nr:hypothetical protein DPMN_157841 [Dreissena polymorpha]
MHLAQAHCMIVAESFYSTSWPQLLHQPLLGILQLCCAAPPVLQMKAIPSHSVGPEVDCHVSI